MYGKFKLGDRVIVTGYGLFNEYATVLHIYPSTEKYVVRVDNASDLLNRWQFYECEMEPAQDQTPPIYTNWDLIKLPKDTPTSEIIEYVCGQMQKAAAIVRNNSREHGIVRFDLPSVCDHEFELGVRQDSNHFNDCDHSWEIKQLFTSHYHKCTKCGTEK